MVGYSASFLFYPGKLRILLQLKLAGELKWTNINNALEYKANNQLLEYNISLL
jgi:hypothetical protein